MPEVIVLTCGGDEFVEPHVWMSVYSMSSVVTSTGERIVGNVATFHSREEAVQRR